MVEPATVEVEVKPIVTDPVPGWPIGIYTALAAAAGEIGAIPKDQQNTAQGFAYRSIESIVGHAKVVFEKYGISVVPNGHEVISSDEVQSGSGSRGFRVVVSAHWRIGHIDGSYIEAAMVGEAIDYGDKATSKAVQMAYKYLLTQMLGIGSEDPDGESPDAGEVVSEADQIKLRVNAVKAAIYKEANDDANAAASVWDGLLDGLKMDPETDLDLEAVAIIEQTWKDKES